MLKYIPLLAAAMLAACSGPAPVVATVSGATPGNYRIAQFLVKPSPELSGGTVSGKMPDFVKFREQVQPLILQQMPAYGQNSTKDLGMTVTVTNILPASDDAYDVLMGNGARVWTEVTLWDPATQQQVGAFPLEMVGDTTSWPRGSGAHVNTPDKNMANLAKHYTGALVGELYPAP